MFSYQFVLIVATLVLYLFKKTRAAAIILLAYLFYDEFIVSIESDYFYYFCTSLLNLIVGFSIQKENIEAAICSFLLVLSTILGFIMWYLYLEPTLYNSISAIILTIQLFTIFPRGLLNGLIDKLVVGIGLFFDSHRSRDTMYKNTQQTKENS